MKLITRTNNIKNHAPLSQMTFTYTLKRNEQNNFEQEQQQAQLQPILQQNNNKLHFLQRKIHRPVNNSNYAYDKSVTTQLESNHAYETVKNPIKNSNLNDWKLLTLKQLSKKNHLSDKRQQRKNNDKSRGIYVSVSQSKRSQKSKEKQSKKYQYQNLTNPISPYFKILDQFSKKGQIIDRLQSHLKKKQQKTQFC